MTWNQPPEKVVTPAHATSMTFVKPSHGDDPEHRPQQIKCSTFDPRQHEHRILNTDAVEYSVQVSIPSTGLQKFWRSCNTSKAVCIPSHCGTMSFMVRLMIHPISPHPLMIASDF